MAIEKRKKKIDRGRCRNVTICDTRAEEIVTKTRKRKCVKATKRGIERERKKEKAEKGNKKKRK